MSISLLPFGEVNQSVLDALREELTFFTNDVDVLPAEEIPQEAFNPEREQYLATFFTDAARQKENWVVLGVTEVDLYVKDLNFVLGVTDLTSRKAAVISTRRLEAPNGNLYLSRVIKEAFHEIGHLLGLGHCPDIACVMHFSNRVLDTDVKGKEYCATCKEKLAEL